MSSGFLQSFSRVTKSSPCPICEKGDWCAHGKPGTEYEGATVCTRIESPIRFGKAGWLHRPAGFRRGRSKPQPRVLVLRRSAPRDETMARLAAAAEVALTSQSLNALAARLGVQPESLTRLTLGLVSARIAHDAGLPWTEGARVFPMRTAIGDIVGLRLRKPDGQKLTWPGGHEGLFLPTGIDGAHQLLICEGPTDTAAALDLGFAAIGRPSCTGGNKEVLEAVRLQQPRSVVVMSDQDEPGRKGAVDLAGSLVRHVPDVRVVLPSGKAKDLRDWVRAGATAADVQQAIDDSPSFRIRTVRGGGPA